MQNINILCWRYGVWFLLAFDCRILSDIILFNSQSFGRQLWELTVTVVTLSHLYWSSRCFCY